MISFFRKIRQKLINEGKTTKYAKYAIGEILLVVIGILIALQINNWNSQRNEQTREQLILKSLKVEFTDNLMRLKSTKSDTIKVYDASINLLELIHPTEVHYTNEEVDNLISLIVNYYTYDAATGTIDEVVNSGKLSIIRNNELKNQISNWSRVIYDISKDIKISNDHLFNFFVIHLTRNGNLKNIPMPASIYNTTKLSPLPRSNFEQDYSKIMSTQEFENLVFWQSVNIIYILKEYEKVQDYLETTITLLDSEIK